MLGLVRPLGSLLKPLGGGKSKPGSTACLGPTPRPGAPAISPLLGHQVSLLSSETADTGSLGGGCLYSTFFLRIPSLEFMVESLALSPPLYFQVCKLEMQSVLAQDGKKGFEHRQHCLNPSPVESHWQVTQSLFFLICKAGVTCPRHEMAVRINDSECDMPSMAPGTRGWSTHRHISSRWRAAPSPEGLAAAGTSTQGRQSSSFEQGIFLVRKKRVFEAHHATH